MRAKQARGQRRRQRQRVDGRNYRGDRNGDGELFVELPCHAGQECHRHEYRAQHQRDGDDGATDFAHGLMGRSQRRQPFGDVALDVFHHHDRVVHHDPDGKHESKKRERIDGKAQHQQHGEGAYHRHRHG